MQKKTVPTYDVIVIGGGASGMMAAGRAAELGRRVLLIEKNPALGAKLKISGGGRCNITNSEEDIHALLKNYGAAAKFLYSTFAQFGVADTFTFFAKLGLSLVVQANNRAFPKTERAVDVARALEKYLASGKVTIFTDTKVTEINNVVNRIESIVAGGVTYTANAYILATGGLSHPETGSTGDGFGWLRDLGHTVVTPTPSIVPLSTKERWSHALSGVSLPIAKVTYYIDGAKQFSRKGPILFTHFGLSGPTILNSAAAVGDLLHTGEVTARIDCNPDLDQGALDKKIITVFDANKNKMLKNIVGEFVAAGLSPGLWLLVPTINPDTKVHSLKKEHRKLLVETLKALPVTVTSLMGFDKAIVVDGGVPLSEIDTKTMRSTILENLFITGDLLLINRPSGGFSLQLCWTTGFVAGSHS